jgi:hypothetical protein
MSVRTIEQKMNSANVWNGAAPSGGLVRSITHDAADNVVASTRIWQFTNGAFTADDVGRLLQMAGTASGNDGVFTVEQVNGPTEIVTTESPNADETFLGGVTQDLYEASGEATLANDMESYAEGVNGGLFDFGQENPILVQQVLVKFGSGTTSWTLSLVDVDAVETVVASASSAAPYLATLYDGDSVSGLILLQGQKLKLVSVGGPTTASVARISVAQHRG